MPFVLVKTAMADVVGDPTGHAFQRLSQPYDVGVRGSGPRRRGDLSAKSAKEFEAKVLDILRRAAGGPNKAVRASEASIPVVGSDGVLRGHVVLNRVPNRETMRVSSFLGPGMETQAPKITSTPLFQEALNGKGRRAFNMEIRQAVDAAWGGKPMLPQHPGRLAVLRGLRRV